MGNKKKDLKLLNIKSVLCCPLLDETNSVRRCSEVGLTETVGTPFLRETSMDLEKVSGSSFALFFSFLSSTAGGSRSIVDREDCERETGRNR